MSEEMLSYYLYLAAFLFSAGLFIVLTRQSAVFVLIGVELILNGSNLVLAFFSQFDPDLNGQVFSIFVIVITVCEVSIALAILLNIYRKSKTSNLEDLTTIGNP